MKKRNVRIVATMLLAVLIALPITIVNAETSSYTYVYDYWSQERESPDTYSVKRVLLASDFGLGDFKSPQGLYIRDNFVYVCDTGNNRIVEFVLENNTYALGRIITTFTKDGAEDRIAEPQDVFVDENGDFYISDTNNHRVLHLDSNLGFIKEIVKPVHETVDATLEFLPTKLIADSAGRVYLLVKNVNKGLMKFEADGEFTGFVGANEVKFDMWEYLWKLISTQEQKAQMAQFVPTEYNNLALDTEGFLYVTTSVFEDWQLEIDEAKPIRKLNAMGTDILVKNGNELPYGDLQWGNAGGVSGPSKFTDITALENDTYFALDRTRGRIFAYDFQGNLLYAFGGIGNQKGYFQLPNAIDHMGSDLYILDGKASSVTVMTTTEYGEVINSALFEYKRGDYDRSADYWGEVLALNGNYDLAYIGIGRALLRQGDYKKAMEYFELKYDDENYSKAYKLYRKEWIEDNIGYVVIGLLTVIIVPWCVRTVKKIRREAMEE